MIHDSQTDDAYHTGASVHVRTSADAAHHAHHQTLRALISQQIQQSPSGISFAHYMDLALYYPSLGYYQRESPQLGQQGDFITAPEISPLFGRCVARQCQQVLENMPHSRQILEIGAGTGRMAADLILALAQVCPLQHYWILEKSAYLARIQAETLQKTCPEQFERVHWLHELPKDFEGCIIANECLDAMPVHRFQMIHGHCHELRVFEHHQTLCQRPILSHNPELIALEKKQIWPEGYTSEIHLWTRPWIGDVSRSLKRGVFLIIDYGFGESEYYHPDRSMGTLMCYRQHRAHTDPFYEPGSQDISAHLNFSAIAAAAQDTGLELLGYTHQAAFLLGCGLDAALKKASDTIQSQQEAQRIHQAVHQLTAPSEMGELFKVMALGRGMDVPLRGFELLDRSHAL